MRSVFLACGLILTPALALACEGREVSEGVLGAPLCLPAAPQRIVVLDPGYSLGMSIELDLPVVAAPLSGMSDEVLAAEALARGVADLGPVTEPSLEGVIAAAPDLIIGPAFLAEPYFDILSSAAPTVLVTEGDWRDYYWVIAAATGREEALEALLAPLDARIAAVAARVPQDRTLSVVRITPWDFQTNLDGEDAYAPFALLGELGVQRSAYESGGAINALKRPDWEDLALLDGDTLFTIIGGMNDSAESGRWEEVTGNPLWQMIPAVAAGRTHAVDPATWMEFSGIASAHRVLDDVEGLFIGQP